MIDNHFIVWNGSSLPARADGSSWTANGDAAVSRLGDLKHPRIGCYQVPVDADLTTIGAVILVQDMPSGAAFHFGPDGKLVRVTISTMDDIRQFLRLPNVWAASPAKCSLL